MKLDIGSSHSGCHPALAVLKKIPQWHCTNADTSVAEDLKLQKAGKSQDRGWVSL